MSALNRIGFLPVFFGGLKLFRRDALHLVVCRFGRFYLPLRPGNDHRQRTDFPNLLRFLQPLLLFLFVEDRFPELTFTGSALARSSFTAGTGVALQHKCLLCISL